MLVGTQTPAITIVFTPTKTVTSGENKKTITLHAYEATFEWTKFAHIIKSAL